MIIRVLKNLAGPDCSYWPGDIVDIRDHAVAETWLADGAAESFDLDAVIASGAAPPHVRVCAPG